MIADLTCTCGSADVFAIQPGQDPVRRGAVDLFTRRDPLVDAGQPTAARCLVCFVARYPGLNRMEAARG